MLNSESFDKSTKKYFRKKTEKKKNDLDKILKKRSMTAEGLAEKVGLSSSAISQFRNSKSNLTIQNIFDITEALNVTIGELFGEVPISYTDIKNIGYVENVNIFTNADDLLDEKNRKNFGISNNLLKILEIIKDIKDIIITKVSNNSMYTTISTTDFIIIDLSQKNIDRNGLYLVKEQNLLEVRRIVINEEDGKVKILLDNEKYMGNLVNHLERSKADGMIEGKILKVIKRDSF
jgi:transcriptional regulator with XRE-family HTH domain